MTPKWRSDKDLQTLCFIIQFSVLFIYYSASQLFLYIKYDVTIQDAIHQERHALLGNVIIKTQLYCVYQIIGTCVVHRTVALKRNENLISVLQTLTKNRNSSTYSASRCSATELRAHVTFLSGLSVF